MGFQTQVNAYPPLGVPGTWADSNPRSTVDAGSGALISAAAGLTVANFAWVTGTTNNGGGTASNTSPTAPTVPDGLVLNQHEALITEWLGIATLVIPEGLGCTLANGGGVWAISPYGAAVRKQKVFANLFNGSILVAAAGSFPVNNIGSSAAFTISGIVNGLMTVTAVASGVLAVGQLVQGVGIPANTYIQALVGGSGSTGTYQLTQTTLNTTGTLACTGTTPAGIGGASVSANVSESFTLTVSSVTYGTVALGMLVKGANIPDGTYIAGLGTGSGGDGDYVMSAAGTGTATETVTLSAWIETPWYALSDGNPGDLIKIGVKF